MTEELLANTAPFHVAGYLVEPSTLRVSGGGEEVRLEAKAMQVLVYLAEHAGSVVSRSEFEQELWPGRIVTEDSVTNAISKLRRVFGDDAHRPRVIETIPKRGYRLIAGVTAAEDVAEKGVPRSESVPAGRQSRRPAISWILGTLSLLLMLAAALVVLDRRGAGTSTTEPVSARPTVAVLPFENLGATPEYDYFANGITADLVTDLSKLDGVSVFSPGSADAVRAPDEQTRQASSLFEADYLILGSVQRQQDVLRINVRIIESRAERALWGERYEAPMSEVFDLQDRLTAEVARAMRVEIAPEERAALRERPTEIVAAYDSYLRGVADHGSRTEVQNLSARSHFEKAIELDPSFARAYTGLALTYSREAIDGWTSTPSRSLELAAEFVQKAADIDPSLLQVHFVTGQVALFQRRHATSIEAAERAIDLYPRYGDAHALLAWTLNYSGQSEKAESALKQAMRLNPRPTSSYFEVLGEIRFAQERYSDSASTFQRVLRANPGYARARMWNAAALARAGDLDAAEWEIAELLVATPDLALARLEFAFPFKDRRTLGVLLDALRKAGLPER